MYLRVNLIWSSLLVIIIVGVAIVAVAEFSAALGHIRVERIEYVSESKLPKPFYMKSGTFRILPAHSVPANVHTPKFSIAAILAALNLYKTPCLRLSNGDLGLSNRFGVNISKFRMRRYTILSISRCILRERFFCW